MIKHNYKNFEIEILNDSSYILDSADNLRQYKYVYFNSNGNEFRPTSKHGIIVKKSKTEISNAIICETGGATTIHHNSFIIEDDKLWICACNKIYCLEIPSLKLIWHKEFDLMTNFSIYKLKNDFIIHGELLIFRISKEGKIIWNFGGRDIWFNPEGYNEVTIEDNTIRLFDFESNEYVLDFNGTQIEDNPRIILKETKPKWWKIFG